MNAELPPLELHCESGRAHAAYTMDSVEARERVLLARIAEADEQLEEVRGHLRYLIAYLTATGALRAERGFTWPDGEHHSVQSYKDVLGDEYKPYFKSLPP